MQSTQDPNPHTRGRTHGTWSCYNNAGCRCDECRAAANARSRERYARRKREGLGRQSVTCQHCGQTVQRDRGKNCTYCTRECYYAAIGSAQPTDWWIHRGWRYRIYERDGWRCQICNDPVDMTAEPTVSRAPSLDHIVPRARGGNDEPTNLRLAHRGLQLPPRHRTHRVPHPQENPDIHRMRGTTTGRSASLPAVSASKSTRG